MPRPIIEILTDHTGAPQMHFMGWDYKAPHANRGTPKKQRRRRGNMVCRPVFGGRV